MEKIRLGEIIHIKHGYAFKGAFFTEEDTGKLVLTPANFTLKGGFQETTKFTSEIGFPEEFILHKGDLIVTMTDLSKDVDTIGYSALVPYNDKHCYLHNQRIGLVTLINQEFDKDYIYWLMRSKQYQRTIANSSNGATVHHTSPAKIYKYLCERKALPIQRRIASILSTYDALIENNTKRIRLLEKMAENLYKEWFVRFRFPGHENVEMENGLPKGWKRGSLSDVCEFKRGKNITSSEMEEGNVPVISAGLEPSGYHSCSNVRGVSVTMSSSGANAGYIAIHYSDIWAADCSYIEEATTDNIYYVYELLNNIRIVINNFQRGAAQPHVYPKDVNRIKLILPSKNLMQKANGRLEIMHREIYNLQKQNSLLARQRDLLLPRLMSGKLEVKVKA